MSTQSETPRPLDVFPGQQHIRNLDGFFSTSSTVPTAKPRSMAEQIVIVTAGGSSRAYFYDTKNLSWLYATLT